MFSRDIYSILFFIYGLSFFSLGISALQQRALKDTDIPLLNSIKILGAFGVIHGLGEWLLIFIMIDRNNSLVMYMLFFTNLLNAIAFTLLWIFGTRLFKKKYNKISYYRLIPFIVIGIWIILYFLFYKFKYQSSVEYIYVFRVIGRYFIGLPAGITVCIGLYRNGKIMSKIKARKVVIKFKILSIFFGLYSILAGLMVSNVDLYPVRIINTETFYCRYGFRLELSRTIVAVVIALLFINVIDIFIWEAEYKIEKLTKQKLIWQERRKVGYELHDRVIQDLFASGLALESIIEDKDGTEKESLIYVKSTLNNVIGEIRGFISKSSLEKLEINDFKIKIAGLIEKMSNISDIEIKLNYKVSEATIGNLSSNTLEQIYYIIQEAICNSIKHSRGSRICVKIQSTLEELVVIVKDDGIGLNNNNIRKEGHCGILSMNERATSINGVLSIDGKINGATVCLIVPWEDIKDDE